MKKLNIFVFQSRVARMIIPFLLLNAMITPARSQDSLRVFSEEEFFSWLIDHHPVARRALLLTARTEATERMARGGFDPKLYADWQQKSFDGKEYFTLGETGFKIPTWLGVELKGNFLVSGGNFLNPQNTLPAVGQAVAGIKLSLLQGMFIDERRAALRQAELVAKLNDAEQLKMLNDLLMEAAKVYWDWSVAYNQLQVYQRALTVTEQRFEGIVESFRQGDIPAVDTLETMIQLQTRRFDVNEAQMAYRNATLQVSNYLWLDGQVPLEISDDLRPATALELPDNLIDPQLAILKETIALRHPELRNYQVQMEQLEIDRRLAAEMLKPRLDVEYNFLGDGFNFMGDNPENGNDLSQLFTQNYKWGIQFSFPLLLRKERGKLELNKIKMMETDFKLREKRLELVNKVEQYYNELINLQNQIAIYQEMTDNYQQLLNAENRKFEIGESSIFLINSREQKLIEARLKLVKLIGSFWKVRAGLEWAGGTLAE